MKIGFQILRRNLKLTITSIGNCRSKLELLRLPAATDRSVKVSSIGDCSMESGSSWLGSGEYCSNMTLRTRNGEERLSVTSEKVLVLLLRTIYGSRRKDVVFVGKCRQLGLWFAARWLGRFMAVLEDSVKLSI